MLFGAGDPIDFLVGSSIVIGILWLSSLSR